MFLMNVEIVILYNKACMFVFVLVICVLLDPKASDFTIITLCSESQPKIER